MAIFIESTHIVIPISVVEAKYPNGWAGFKTAFPFEVGGTLWHDQHLVSFGVQDASLLDLVLAVLRMADLNPFERVDSEIVWVDVAVVERAHDGRCPATWLAFAEDGRAVYFKGTEPGPVACRDNPEGA